MTSKTEEVLEQLQESYPFSCLDGLASTPLTGASVPYNPLSHWGSIGSVRSSPYTMGYHSRTYPLPSEDLHSSTVSYHNPRTKTYEDKMEKQRLEHFLFAGGLDRQKERLRRKLNDKLNEKPTVEKAKTASPAVSSQNHQTHEHSHSHSQGKKQSKKEKRRGRNRKKAKKQKRNRKKREAQKQKRENAHHSASPYTSSSSVNCVNKSPVDPDIPAQDASDRSAESDLEQLVLADAGTHSHSHSQHSHSMTLADTLESEIADGDHSAERESPSVTLAGLALMEAGAVDDDSEEEREAEKPGNALNAHLLDALSAQSKEIAALKESVTALRATVSRLENRLHTVELMEAQQALSASDGRAGHEAVRAWMRDEVGLEQYAYLLIDNGFEDMLAVRTLDMRLLDSVRGIDKIGHKSRILYFVDRLKEQEEEVCTEDETHEF